MFIPIGESRTLPTCGGGSITIRPIAEVGGCVGCVFNKCNREDGLECTKAVVLIGDVPLCSSAHPLPLHRRTDSQSVIFIETDGSDPNSGKKFRVQEHVPDTYFFVWLDGEAKTFTGSREQCYERYQQISAEGKQILHELTNITWLFSNKG
jgi:hypothetical protein